MKTRIVIVDDHAILRAGLRIFLNEQEDIEVVGEAGDCGSAKQTIADARPDVVTLDINLPGEGGLALLKQLRRDFPLIHVLVLTMHDDAEYLKVALAAGAAGYVTKTADEGEILTAIRAIRQGRTHFGLSMYAGLQELPFNVATESDRHSPPPDSSPLSEREQEVLAMVARGLTNQQAADALFLSVKTIETYRSRLMVKLGLHSRAELVAYALDNGILQNAPCG